MTGAVPDLQKKRVGCRLAGVQERVFTMHEQSEGGACIKGSLHFTSLCKASARALNGHFSSGRHSNNIQPPPPPPVLLLPSFILWSSKLL